MNYVSIDLYISEDSYISEVDGEEHGSELASQNVEIENFRVPVPTQTIYYAAATSDGYVSTFFYPTKSLRDFHMEVDECFWATDSEGQFECAFFPGGMLHTLSDILSTLYGDESIHVASKYLIDNDMKEVLDIWLPRWGIFDEQA